MLDGQEAKCLKFGVVVDQLRMLRGTILEIILFETGYHVAHTEDKLKKIG